jgi:hypothetical protein
MLPRPFDKIEYWLVRVAVLILLVIALVRLIRAELHF